MSSPEFESFLHPISAATPSGDDLEYDPVFRELAEAGEYKPETEYGGRVYEAREPVWPVVHAKALELAARTHDLRVAVWIARSSARVEGLPAYVEGLRLVGGLLERYWPSVHPQLDAADADDPTARLNALVPLAAPRDGLADLRAVVLTSHRGTLTVRDVELAFRAADPLAGESAPTPDGVHQAIAAEERLTPGLVEALRAGRDALAALVRTLEAHLDRSLLPDFGALDKLLGALTAAVPGATVPTSAATDVATIAPERARVAGALDSREDAIRMLESVCAWLDKNDPSSPAPLLIRRAQRLMQKNFLDIIRDLAPDTLDQIEKLAGIERS